MSEAVHDAPSMPSWLDDNTSDALLIAIDEVGSPVGARQISAALAERGRHLSESTVARRLRHLDAEGLTLQIGVKGRVLTDAGNRAVERLRRTSRSASLVSASEVRTAQDVVNLLKARRAIEPEAVRDATTHISDAELAALSTVVAEHRNRASAKERPPRDIALTFHRLLSAPAQNPLVQAMVGIVLDDSHDHVEAALDVILEAHHHSAVSVSEHEAIIEAMAQRDAERAADLMRAHLDRLLEEVDTFITRYDSELLERLLRLP
ncbi:FCD domain-containing protein [Streptomyces sp. NBC_01320]|uniref:FCD domain-containing protein n=1 Tax=Streptomyces sp. NBC_01320 TaxID=2903824 RepID=UPI002E15FC98|nr:FCD domain-containing protein [Streptomyces sp. NBC_01320]WSK01103.1 FCD domain-containing protein [Streptomyces sp. NBC_01320]